MTKQAATVLFKVTLKYGHFKSTLLRKGIMNASFALLAVEHTSFTEVSYVACFYKTLGGRLKRRPQFILKRSSFVLPQFGCVAKQNRIFQ
jgi:1-acyl-sn-glycerol-3-phosphate acyltransferase